MSIASRWRVAPAAILTLAGAAHALTFAPGPLPDWSLAAVQILCLAVLAHATMHSARPRQALLRGWWFATVYFSLGLYWLYVSMHDYGDLAAPLAGGGVLALSAFLALFPGMACVLARWLLPAPARSPCRAMLTWAACWTLFEWLRATVLTGFPWLNIGYAQVDSPIAGWAPVLGVHGMAMIAACAAAALAQAWQWNPRRIALSSDLDGTPIRTISAPARASSAQRAGRVMPPLGPQGVSAHRGGSTNGGSSNSRSTNRSIPIPARSPWLALGFALALVLAGFALQHVDWSQPTGHPLYARLVQGNIPQSQKFNPDLIQEGLDTHFKLALQAPPQGEPAPDVIILPETVLPVFQDQLDPRVWDAWRAVATRQDATIIMGVPLRTRSLQGQTHYTNSAIAITSHTSTEALLNGLVTPRYDKHHLVPWGEYVPPGFHWFVDMLNIPLGDFDRGPARQKPFNAADQSLALNICYEDLFGPELLPALRGVNGEPGATILVNISNLGWFGDTWALRQHLQIGRLRTLETARPMLAATNTGITTSIDAQGHVQASLPAHQPGVLDVYVQGMQGLTPYARSGDMPIVLVIALLLILGVERAWYSGRKRA